METKYSMRVEWSDEDGGFVAYCPEFDDLPAFGETIEEAVAELTVAITLVSASMREQGKELPVEKTACRMSGQFRVRVPRALHGQLVDQAARERISLNSLVCTYLASAVTDFEFKARTKDFLNRELRPIISTTVSGVSGDIRRQVAKALNSVDVHAFAQVPAFAAGVRSGSEGYDA